MDIQYLPNLPKLGDNDEPNKGDIGINNQEILSGDEYNELDNLMTNMMEDENASG